MTAQHPRELVDGDFADDWATHGDDVVRWRGSVAAVVGRRGRYVVMVVVFGAAFGLPLLLGALAGPPDDDPDTPIVEGPGSYEPHPVLEAIGAFVSSPLGLGVLLLLAVGAAVVGQVATSRRVASVAAMAHPRLPAHPGDELVLTDTHLAVLVGGTPMAALRHEGRVRHVDAVRIELVHDDGIVQEIPIVVSLPELATLRSTVFPDRYGPPTALDRVFTMSSAYALTTMVAAFGIAGVMLDHLRGPSADLGGPGVLLLLASLGLGVATAGWYLRYLRSR